MLDISFAMHFVSRCRKFEYTTLSFRALYQSILEFKKILVKAQPHCSTVFGLSMAIVSTKHQVVITKDNEERSDQKGGQSCSDDEEEREYGKVYSDC